MSEQLKYIISELNKEPFNKNYNLISFDNLTPLNLLQVLTDVLAEIDSKHKIDVRHEEADTMAIRILAALRVLKYRPPAELASTFRQSLVSGDKSTLYPLLQWLLQRIPELVKRAYLAKYLMKLEITHEFRDDQIDELYNQYENMIDEFKDAHKEHQQLISNGFSTADIKRDILSMEEEREQLIRRVDRLKRKVESQPNSGEMLTAARDLRLEKDKDEKIKKQKYEQKNSIIQLDQHIDRLEHQIKDEKQSSIGATADGLITKLNEEIKELNLLTSSVHDLQSVALEPAMGQSDIDIIKHKMKSVNAEVNQLVEKKMVKNDPSDDKLSLFRQQAAIIARKKEVIAEKLSEQREELDSLEKEVQHKRSEGKVDTEAVDGEEFKRYVNKLRTKSTLFKAKRADISELRAESGVLCRTHELLKSRQDLIIAQQNQMEDKQGVSGYRRTQEALEKASNIKGQLDDVKGKTLEDISALVQKLTKRINEKKAALAPVVTELRSVRLKCQEISNEYEEKKTTYETISAGLDSNTSKLEHEVNAYKEELNASESRYHYVEAMLMILSEQQRRVDEEVKIYTSTDPGIKKKSLREQYTKKIQEQDIIGKNLRDKQKSLKENQVGNSAQMNIWRDFTKLMQCKLDIVQRNPENQMIINH